MKLLWVALAMLCISVSWAADNPAASVSGTVLEAKEVESYTYLRLKTKDGETWAAVARTPVKKGAEVTIDNVMVMTNFESKSLKRKFEKIVFGSLGGAAAGPAVSPHSGVAKATDVGNVKVAKATGPNARTVAEIVTQKGDLKNKTVLVRGKVVKFTPDILGKNWVHLQDGSGSAKDNTHDVLVTTKDQAKIGDVVVAKGVVHTDKDLGSGYSYKVLIEEAVLQK
ncbi:MAG: nucleotide-binding protein [Burkholderiales bacterium]|nr:nucleotide-binding protein [Burkholderiales bacterium]